MSSKGIILIIILVLLIPALFIFVSGTTSKQDEVTTSLTNNAEVGITEEELVAFKLQCSEHGYFFDEEETACYTPFKEEEVSEETTVLNEEREFFEAFCLAYGVNLGLTSVTEPTVDGGIRYTTLLQCYPNSKQDEVTTSLTNNAEVGITEEELVAFKLQCSEHGYFFDEEETACYTPFKEEEVSEETTVLNEEREFFEAFCLAYGVNLGLTSVTEPTVDGGIRYTTLLQCYPNVALLTLLEK